MLSYIRRKKLEHHQANILRAAKCINSDYNFEIRRVDESVFSPPLSIIYGVSRNKVDVKQWYTLRKMKLCDKYPSTFDFVAWHTDKAKVFSIGCIDGTELLLYHAIAQLSAEVRAFHPRTIDRVVVKYMTIVNGMYARSVGCQSLWVAACHDVAHIYSCFGYRRLRDDNRRVYLEINVNNALSLSLDKGELRA